MNEVPVRHGRQTIGTPKKIRTFLACHRWCLPHDFQVSNFSLFGSCYIYTYVCVYIYIYVCIYIYVYIHRYHISTCTNIICICLCLKIIQKLTETIQDLPGCNDNTQCGAHLQHSRRRRKVLGIDHVFLGIYPLPADFLKVGIGWYRWVKIHNLVDRRDHRESAMTGMSPQVSRQSSAPEGHVTWQFPGHQG